MSSKSKSPLFGILGGMGTAAGLEFQNIFFKYCHTRGISGDQDYPEWLYVNASLTPDRTKAIKGEGESPVNYLVNMIKRMQAAGVEAIVVACNTVHAYYNEIYGQVPVPWIHLQRETANRIKEDGMKKVGILATEGTIRAGLFRRMLEPLGISVVEPEPDSELQAGIMQAIFDPVFGIKQTGDKISQQSKLLLTEAIDTMGVESVIAGCTELSLAFSEMDLPAGYYDPMLIAAETLYKLWTGERSIESLR